METIKWYRNTMTMINWSLRLNTGQKWCMRSNGSDTDLHNSHNYNHNNSTITLQQHFNNKLTTTQSPKTITTKQPNNHRNSRQRKIWTKPINILTPKISDRANVNNKKTEH